MKNIVSFNVPIRDFTLEKLIDFYFMCRSSDNNMHLYTDGKIYRIERVTELIAFTLTSAEERLAIIVEGEQALNTLKHIIKVYGNNSDARVI